MLFFASRVRLHVLQHIRQPCPHLLTTGHNLGCRKHKAVPACISQLDRHREGCLCIFRGVINTGAADLVDGRADGSSCECGSVHSLDGCNSALCQALVLCGLGNDARTCVAVWVHPKLRVGVNVHVELDALACGDAVEVSFEGFGLDAIADRRALVVLSARGGAGPVRQIPVRGPVTVDVTSYTACCRCALAVLAPQTVAGLREGEAVWVDNGEN